MGALKIIAENIDRINDTIGRFVSWFALFMVLTQFLVVLLRYVFGVGFIWLQESVIYMHSLVFMVGAGYTLLYEGHVRVDVFYREAKPKTKAWIDLFGVLFLLLPVCLLIWLSSFGYVQNSWAIFEGSKETSGIQAVFLLKSLILVFAFLVSIQGISIALKAFLVIKGVIESPQNTNEELI